MTQEYNPTDELFLVILKSFISIVFGVGFGVAFYLFYVYVSLGKELMFIKWGKRPILTV